MTKNSHVPLKKSLEKTRECKVENKVITFVLCTLQSLTRKYRGLQGNPCNENRDPVVRTGVPCNKNKFFTVRIDLEFPVSLTGFGFAVHVKIL